MGSSVLVSLILEVFIVKRVCHVWSVVSLYHTLYFSSGSSEGTMRHLVPFGSSRSSRMSFVRVAVLGVVTSGSCGVW